MRILLAEDDDAIRDIITRLLERLDAEVEAARDGAEALDIFRRRGSFDLVLLDLGMPALDGERTARAMRDIEAGSGRPRAPIVALTGADEDETLARSGFDGMVQKPVGLSALKGLLEKWSPGGGP